MPTETQRAAKLGIKKAKFFNWIYFLTKNKIIHVGGRLQNSYINDEFKHPILLPKRAKISDLSINPYNKVSHGGCGFTLNKVRGVGYWITGANSAAKEVIFSYIQCCRLRGGLEEQKMAKLHVCRLKETARFSHCGVNKIGLFMVKQRKSTAKWHDALFTCMAGRAVPIEVTFSLDIYSWDWLYNEETLNHYIQTMGIISLNWKGKLKNWLGMDDRKIKFFSTKTRWRLD